MTVDDQQLRRWARRARERNFVVELKPDELEALLDRVVALETALRDDPDDAGVDRRRT